MTQTVRDIVLGPMTELYLPPLHLRRDAQAQARALAAYEQALAGFDRDALQKGWDKVVAGQTYWVWPNPGTIAEACRQCAKRSLPTGEEEQRRQQALDLAEAYTARYLKTSHLAKLARREGWSGRLREYVADAAWVQAQLIAGVRHLGWNACLAEDFGPFRSSQQAFEEYRQTIEPAIERGQIRVAVPKSRIRQWRFGQAAQDPTPDTDAPVALAKTGTDGHSK